MGYIVHPPPMSLPERPPEEKGWRIELIDVPLGQYSSVKGEQWWRSETGLWHPSIVGEGYIYPRYVRIPCKTFDGDQWCDDCELPAEDCCCGAVHKIPPLPPKEPVCSPGDGAAAAYKVAGVVLHRTRNIVCDAMGNVVSDDDHPPFDSAEGRAIRRAHYLCVGVLALLLAGLIIYLSHK